MARRKVEEDERIQTNLTPMIDVVFQLLIFFMLVTDLSRRQIEPIKLPVADQAFKEDNVDPDELIINIMPPQGVQPADDKDLSSEIRVNGMPVHTSWLETHFKHRRANPQYQEIQGSQQFVRYPLLIRSDRSAYWMEIQRIMMMATRYGGVYKTALAAKMPMGR